MTVTPFDYLCPVCGKMGFESETKGMCDPCECEMQLKERDEKVAKELAKWAKRTGIEVDESTFMNMCMDGVIDRQTLKRLPELRDDYDWCEGWKAEVNAPYDVQGDLFTQGDDFPF